MTYLPILSVINSIGELFSTEDIIIGVYLLNDYWVTPRGSTQKSLNYAERTVFTNTIY